MAMLVEWVPDECPNGHRWSKGKFLAGWCNTRDVPCRYWICKVCDAAIYND
ncbi:hypothetical protein [Williamsia phyllosphaerae]|uniref:Uncharacterized protein n=1 Tax=Williamsia phyllosphaerae TaxID=885042 RepID=A0ABQ1V4Z4_9NOCA|nr:hypothetical protein [Williamsia phyllosphaerae]GGF39270.1 hypothetical protein GCM10007298_38730 [Williamsia phyllosphaerae]